MFASEKRLLAILKAAWRLLIPHWKDLILATISKVTLYARLILVLIPSITLASVRVITSESSSISSPALSISSLKSLSSFSILSTPSTSFLSIISIIFPLEFVFCKTSWQPFVIYQFFWISFFILNCFCKVFLVFFCRVSSFWWVWVWITMICKHN